MANEQPITILDSPYEDELDRYVGEEILGEKPVSEAASVEPEEDETQEVEAAPDEDKAEDEPEYVEIKHNGKAVKLTVDEVLEHASKGFDYTQKTQEIAEQRRQVEALAQTVQQQYQLQQSTIQETAKLFAMDSQLANYQGANWDAWMDQDPIEASKGWQKFQMLKSQRDETANTIQQAQNQAQYMTQTQLQQKLSEGARTLASEIKGWSPELAHALKSNGLEYGFSETELDQVYDPRMVKVLHDAYQWRQLQAKKPEVQKRVNLAPKSPKPSGKVDDSAQNRNVLLKKLKSGRSESTRRAIADSLLDKFV
jgi:hypothetical protein